MVDDITVIIPSIPPRTKLLRRAVDSVSAQTLPATRTIVRIDHHRGGAAVTRDAALAEVTTEWTATLDDDDEFLPEHLEKLLRTALEENADYVYSFPEMPVDGTVNPISCFNGQKWRKDRPHETTVVALYRTEIAKSIGGYNGDWHSEGEDYHFTLKFNEVGKIVHHPEATWRWYHHGQNTSGLPERW